MLLNNVDPETWYKVSEVSKIVGWSEDTVRDWIHAKRLIAFIKPITSNRRKRLWMGMRVQGRELIRFIRDNLSGPPK